MIWDFIRDFIVQNITGGINSDGTLFGATAGFMYDSDGVETGYSNCDIFYQIGKDLHGNITSISFSDWLATTLTAICMCLIVAFAIWLVIWVFKVVAHAFLLRR